MTPPPPAAARAPRVRAAVAMPAPAPRTVPAPGRTRRPAPASRRVVARAVESVGTAADSQAISWVARGNRWMPLLCVLLIGIVALSVNLVRINASAGEAGAMADQLRRQNSELQVQIAAQTSGRRVELAANGLGMFLPLPEAIRSLSLTGGSAEAAAARLLAGEIAIGTFALESPGGYPASDGLGTSAAVGGGTEASAASGTSTSSTATPETSVPGTGNSGGTGASAATGTSAGGPATSGGGNGATAGGGAGGGGGGAL